MHTFPGTRRWASSCGNFTVGRTHCVAGGDSSKLAISERPKRAFLMGLNFSLSEIVRATQEKADGHGKAIIHNLSGQNLAS